MLGISHDVGLSASSGNPRLAKCKNTLSYARGLVGAFCTTLLLCTTGWAAEKFKPSRFICTVSEVSTHNIGEPSFQHDVPPGTTSFILRIEKPTKPDPDTVWCDTEVSTPFQQA